MNNLNEIEKQLKVHQYCWLITGVAGFIGSNLLEFLLKNNQKVIGLDNFSTGFQSNLDEVEQRVGSEFWSNFTFIKGDLREVLDCEKACLGVDYILHQGALGSVPRSIKDPLTSNEVNVSGTLNLFWSAKKANVKKIIFASSSSVYGDDPSLPKVEGFVGNPLSPYAITKKINELYARVFFEQYEIEIIGIRYFNVFGPRQNPEGVYAAVIPKWIRAFIKNEPIVIFGDGETSRDFTYIDNVVALNILSALSGFKTEPGTIINGALGDKTSLNELYKLLQNELSKRIANFTFNPPVYEGFRPGDIRHSLASMEKAKKIFNYDPLVKINEGIEKSMDWYLKNI